MLKERLLRAQEEEEEGELEVPVGARVDGGDDEALPFVLQRLQEEKEEEEELTRSRVLHHRRRDGPGAADPGPFSSFVEFSPVTSASPARLRLSPTSRLHGAPGETVTVREAGPVF